MILSVSDVSTHNLAVVTRFEVALESPSPLTSLMMLYQHCADANLPVSDMFGPNLAEAIALYTRTGPI